MYYGLLRPALYQPDYAYHSKLTQQSNKLFYQENKGDFTE